MIFVQFSVTCHWNWICQNVDSLTFKHFGSRTWLTNLITISKTKTIAFTCTFLRVIWMLLFVGQDNWEFIVSQNSWSSLITRGQFLKGGINYISYNSYSRDKSAILGIPIPGINFFANKIYPMQHGFVKGRSTITQLLDTVHWIVRTIGQGEQTDVAFLDFSKAFVSVSHAHLIRKVDQSGIKGPLLHWFISYLGNRLQQVVIDGKASFSDHIHTQVNRANKMVAFIHRTINGSKILSLTRRFLYVCTFSPRVSLWNLEP